MNRPLSILLFALTGCTSLDPATLITRDRVLGAKVTVDVDPQRAWPRPGEQATMTWLTASPGPAPMFSWILAACPAATSSGFPMPGYEFRVVDPETGSDRPTGEPGELLLRSYMVTQGYYREPELTAQAIDADGWLHTGDLGSLRADGHVRFLGRFKDMLKVGGENVSPLEVEGYLLERHPLLQIAIVGYPDARLDEVPVAFAVPAPACVLDEEELEAAIIGSCRGRLASFKIPRRVLVVAALPMTASGKVQKHLLRDLALELLGVPAGTRPRP